MTRMSHVLVYATDNLRIEQMQVLPSPLVKIDLNLRKNFSCSSVMGPSKSSPRYSCGDVKCSDKSRLPGKRDSSNSAPAWCNILLHRKAYCENLAGKYGKPKDAIKAVDGCAYSPMTLNPLKVPQVLFRTQCFGREHETFLEDCGVL